MLALFSMVTEALRSLENSIFGKLLVLENGKGMQDMGFLDDKLSMRRQ